MAYIDTEGTFRAEKIRAIATRFDLDADAVLDNVVPLQSHHQLNRDCMIDRTVAGSCTIKRKMTTTQL